MYLAWFPAGGSHLSGVWTVHHPFQKHHCNWHENRGWEISCMAPGEAVEKTEHVQSIRDGGLRGRDGELRGRGGGLRDRGGGLRGRLRIRIAWRDGELKGRIRIRRIRIRTDWRGGELKGRIRIRRIRIRIAWRGGELKGRGGELRGRGGGLRERGGGLRERGGGLRAGALVRQDSSSLTQSSRRRFLRASGAARPRSLPAPSRLLGRK